MSEYSGYSIGPELDSSGQIGGIFSGKNLVNHRAEALILLVIIVIILVAIYILAEEKIFNIIAQDLRSPVFILGIIAAILFIGWVFTRPRGTTPAELEDSKKLESATRHGIVALIISYLAHLNLYFLSFVAVFVFVYLATDWA